MYFLQESFLRLEHFVRDCATYHRGVGSGLAVLFSYTAILTYVLFALVSHLYRRWVVIFFALGFGAAGGVLFAVSVAGPVVTNAHAPCAVEVDGRPAEEATIVVYTAAFLWLYDWSHPPVVWRRDCVWALLRLALSALYVGASLGSTYYLGLQPSVALLAGAAVGAAVAALTVWGLCLVDTEDPRLSFLGAVLLKVKKPSTYQRVSITDDEDPQHSFLSTAPQAKPSAFQRVPDTDDGL